MTPIEVSALIGGVVLHAVAARGGDTSALTAAVGFDPTLATDPDARMPLAMEEALYETAARQLGDDAFGIHAAELLPPGAFDVLDYAVRTAPNLRGALDRLVRYNRLVHDAAEFRLVPRGEVMRVEHGYRYGSAVQSRHSAEFTLAAVVLLGRQISEVHFVPRAVEFRHAAPSSSSSFALAELRRVFGIEPTFAAATNALELDRSVLDRPLPKADLRLSKVVERHAESLLAAHVDPAITIVERVRRVLVGAIGESATTLAAIAERLKMSERTLQRKLADEGASFDAILDDVRKELALRYLADRKLAIAEVAFLLGYSEPSPFHRAFKRWTGKTPSEARRAA